MNGITVLSKCRFCYAREEGKLVFDIADNIISNYLLKPSFLRFLAHLRSKEDK